MRPLLGACGKKTSNALCPLLGACGKKTSNALCPFSTHEPVKLIFLGHTRHKICNNIPRIEDNLKENIQRAMSSVSPSAGRLAMNSVIIRRDCKPKDTNSNTFFNPLALEMDI